MGFDDKFRSCSLEAYPTLDADDSVADVCITTYCIACADLFDFLYCLNLVIKLLIIDGNDFSFVESYLESSLCFLRCDVLEVSLLWESFGRIKQFSAANTCAPDTYIV